MRKYYYIKQAETFGKYSRIEETSKGIFVDGVLVAWPEIEATLEELEEARHVYHIDEDATEWCNYNIGDGWQIPCVEGEITAGEWLALRGNDEIRVQVIP